MPLPTIEAAYRTLVAAMAGPDPLPAGGAAGIASIAMGTALATKVLRLSPSTPQLNELHARLDGLLGAVLPEFAVDCAAFEALLAAMQRPRDDGGRADAITAAWREATVAPQRIAQLAAEIESVLLRCEGQVNPNLAADLSAARELVGAGLRIAAANASENGERLARRG